MPHLLHTPRRQQQDHCQHHQGGVWQSKKWAAVSAVINGGPQGQGHLLWCLRAQGQDVPWWSGPERQLLHRACLWCLLRSRVCICNIRMVHMQAHVQADDDSEHVSHLPLAAGSDSLLAATYIHLLIHMTANRCLFGRRTNKFYAHSCCIIPWLLTLSRLHTPHLLLAWFVVTSCQRRTWPADLSTCMSLLVVVWMVLSFHITAACLVI